MTRKTPAGTLTMKGPAIYRIIVKGALDPSWAQNVLGMSISERRSEEGGSETILVGRLLDQAALSSVFTALYDMHLPVVSADCLDSE